MYYNNYKGHFHWFSGAFSARGSPAIARRIDRGWYHGARQEWQACGRREKPARRSTYMVSQAGALPEKPNWASFSSIATRAGMTPARFIPSWFSGQEIVKLVTSTAAFMPIALLIGWCDSCNEWLLRYLTKVGSGMRLGSDLERRAGRDSNLEEEVPWQAFQPASCSEGNSVLHAIECQVAQHAERGRNDLLGLDTSLTSDRVVSTIISNSSMNESNFEASLAGCVADWFC